MNNNDQKLLLRLVILLESMEFYIEGIIRDTLNKNISNIKKILELFKVQIDPFIEELSLEVYIG
jgi:hypothetical protein